MNFKDIYKQPPIRDKQWIFPFGQHKGETLEEVMSTNPNYISFLQSKEILDFHSDIFDEIDGTYSQMWRNTMAQGIEDW